MESPLRPLKNNRGIALLIAIFSMGLLAFIANEIYFETNVEYVVSAQKLNRLKSYHAAKSGIKLSLLRVLLYKKAMASFGEQLGGNKTLLDPIWNFPFAWPPSKFVPTDDVTTITMDSLKTVEKESTMDTTYITTIESEGGKIDINDLGSDIKALREQTKQQVLKIFKVEMENSESFAEEWRNTDFEQLVNNMVDWVDENKEREGIGGGEQEPYSEVIKEYEIEEIPPNTPFKSIEEIHMVAGMKDAFYDLLKDRVTVFGIKGININFADDKLLKSLDERIDDELVKEIKKRRDNPEEGGPFTSEEDFLEFLDRFINVENFNEGGIPLIFEEPMNFRIVSTGEFAGTSSEITVVTYDIDNLVERMIDLLDKQDEEEKKGQTDDSQSDDKKDDEKKDDETKTDENGEKKDSKDEKKDSKKVPKGQPRIVLWQER